MPNRNKESKKKPGPKAKAGKNGAKLKPTGKISRPVPGTKRGFYIVGMGASAGGLEAFEKFFKNMPANSGVAFVLVPHLDPTHVSLMPDLIQKNTTMDVLQIKDRMKVKPNTVYITPPKKNIDIFHGVLHLIEPAGGPGFKLPIDHFLRSLAQDQGEKAVCVILSGMGSDGTLGLKDIKSELGLVIAQEPASAKFESMPGSAIQTGLTDYILPPQKMPEQILKYTSHATGNYKQCKIVPGTKGDIPEALHKIFIMLRSQTGHDFSYYKPTTIYRRIERRMNVHHLDEMSAYVRYLQHNPKEINTLFRELLIGVTSFFRDPDAFEALRQKALPQHLKNKVEGDALRVWVPGCSTGEEAYSAAIIVSECIEECDKNFAVQIFATDIDTEAINIARTGAYPESIAADISPDRLKRYFIKKDSAYRIKKDIREMIVFAPQDVIKDPPFTKLDMICCRNLLIYLDSVLQKKLLPLFHYSLQPGGILFLGTSETIGGYVDLFAMLDKKWKIFKRRDSSATAHGMLEFPITPAVEKEIQIQSIKPPEAVSIPHIAQQKLLQSYAPPSVIINKDSQILYFHGRTGVYLEPAQGEANLNIMEMAREGLRLELSTAIRRAISQKKDVTIEDVQIKDNGGVKTINLIVTQMVEPEISESLLMVSFLDVSHREKKKTGAAKRSRKPKADERVEALEKELRYTRENLQTTIEELETSNEELKSTNEELQSTNEELQSTNEEMETAREEQQSLNEELITVNTELQEKIQELSIANNDMRNLLDSIEVPTVFLDNELKVKRFTSHTAKVINLIQTDIGRPIEHIASNLKYSHLVEDARQVLKTLVYREIEVQTNEGLWYLMRILPYRTIDHVIDGVVITFLNITEQKISAKAVDDLSKSAQLSREYADIVETLREPILLLDSDLKVFLANGSFYRFFRVTAEETVGQYIYNVGNRQWDIPALRKLFESIISANQAVENFEVAHKFKHIGHKKMFVNARKIAPGKEKNVLILLTFEEDAAAQKK